MFLAGRFFSVNDVPVWLEVLSKLNPLKYGADAIRQTFLASAALIVLGHTMTKGEAFVPWLAYPPRSSPSTARSSAP